MSDFSASGEKDGFSLKLWRGERMCLLGFDVDDPEPDFVGFAVECRAPGERRFESLRNRLAFSYPTPAETAVTGARQFPTTEAPFQKFRWVHFPHDPKPGAYTYRVTRMHMPSDGVLRSGTSLTLKLPLDPVTYAGFVDVGFTRGFASSQAFRERVPAGMDPDVFGRSIIPSTADEGLDFRKGDPEIYDWLGFEGRDLLFGLLTEAVDDPTVTLDLFAYDLNEPEMVARLEALGPRLRALIDDSTEEKTDGTVKGHGTPESSESRAAARLSASAGAANVKRTHFKNLQHHKVLVLRRNGVPYKVLAGSTNFSFRGIYIQSNNVLVFEEPRIAGLFGQVFDAAFADAGRFSATELASRWHLVETEGKPTIHLCFSPHRSPDLALNPVRGAIDQATSSVLYSIAFLNLLRKGGSTRDALDRLMKRPVFSYGVADVVGKGLEVHKPDGSTGLVDFAYLARNAPEPFKSEWGGGSGINVHHKFVVTDFSLPTAKVFTGSSNLSPSGEKNNGDHLIMIEDCRIATAYAIEALRVFDHLHFRSRLQAAQVARDAGNDRHPDPLTLRKPSAITRRPAWFERFYKPGSQRERDRRLFSR